LKAKYARRKTEACLNTTAADIENKTETSSSSNSNNNNKNNSRDEQHQGRSSNHSTGRPPGPPTRTLSMPLIQQLDQLPQLRALHLAWDPLTGAAIGEETEEVKEEELQDQPVATTAATAASDCDPSSRKSSGYRLSGHFGEIMEQIIPLEEILECFIDPFTGE
jgi:hypothetical protein